MVTYEARQRSVSSGITELVIYGPILFPIKQQRFSVRVKLSVIDSYVFAANFENSKVTARKVCKYLSVCQCRIFIVGSILSLLQYWQKYN